MGRFEELLHSLNMAMELTRVTISALFLLVAFGSSNAKGKKRRNLISFVNSLKLYYYSAYSSTGHFFEVPYAFFWKLISASSVLQFSFVISVVLFSTGFAALKAQTLKIASIFEPCQLLFSPFNLIHTFTRNIIHTLNHYPPFVLYHISSAFSYLSQFFCNFSSPFMLCLINLHSH